MPQLIPRPQSYDELRARPAFREVLDKKEHALRQVLTDYSFPTMVACGLSHCRTPHRDGFLVQTEDDLETNVGHVCGRKAFGKRFDIARQTYERMRERQDLVDRARLIVEQEQAIRERVAELYDVRFGANWVRRLRQALYGVLGADLFESLVTAEKRQDRAVTVTRRRTSAEVEQIVERTRQKREQVLIETNTVGNLAPMPWICFDFTGQMQSGLLEPLNAFILLDHAALETPRLRRLVKQFERWEERVNEANDAARSGAAFFEPTNLDLLSLWIPERMQSRRRALDEWRAGDKINNLASGM